MFRYQLKLDSESSHWGYMSCKMTGSYVGKTVRLQLNLPLVVNN